MSHVLQTHGGGNKAGLHQTRRSCFSFQLQVFRAEPEVLGRGARPVRAASSSAEELWQLQRLQPGPRVRPASWSFVCRAL